MDCNGECWAATNHQVTQIHYLNSFTFKNLECPAVITQISASTHFALLLSTEGEVWYFGSLGKIVAYEPEEFFNIRKLDNLPKISMVAAGPHHSLYLDENGAVWAKYVINKDPFLLNLKLAMKSVHAGEQGISILIDVNGGV